ncbi:MAG: exosortase/archaeosortase family protein, partial [Candidatus Diapherotrites archaeon]
AITSSCTGLASLSVWLAAVLPLKQPKWKTKVLWLIVGGVALMLANVLRLLLVVQSGVAFGVPVAEIVHIISWFGMSILIIAAWFYGLKRMKIDIAKAF